MTVRSDVFKVDFSGNDGGNDALASGAIIDRSRWQFDQDGFALANDAARLVAQQQLKEKIISVNADLVQSASPIDYGVTVDGVPIDKVNFEK